MVALQPVGCTSRPRRCGRAVRLVLVLCLCLACFSASRGTAEETTHTHGFGEGHWGCSQVHKSSLQRRIDEEIRQGGRVVTFSTANSHTAASDNVADAAAAASAEELSRGSAAVRTGGVSLPAEGGDEPPPAAAAASEDGALRSAPPVPALALRAGSSKEKREKEKTDDPAIAAAATTAQESVRAPGTPVAAAAETHTLVPGDKDVPPLTPPSLRSASLSPSSSRATPLRVKVDVTHLYRTDSVCTEAGQVRSDMLENQNVSCVEADILTDAKRDYLIQRVLPAVVHRVQRLFSLPRRDHDDDKDNDNDDKGKRNGEASARSVFYVPQWICGPFVHIPQEHSKDGIAGADIVIYAMAAPVSAPAPPGAAASSPRPSEAGGPSGSGTIAWSGYCGVDPHGRPVVARMNFAPRFISPYGARSGLFGGDGVSPATAARGASVPSASAMALAQRSTVLEGDPPSWWAELYIRAVMHEIFHALGFAPPFLETVGTHVQDSLFQPVNTSTTAASVGRAFQTAAARGGGRSAKSPRSTAAPPPSPSPTGPYSLTGAQRVLCTAPLVVQAAREFFNCSTLVGVPYENDGGDGTASAHWERRYLRDDLMAGSLSPLVAISPITLAFFESLPFYRVNMAYAESAAMVWGRRAGCSFLDDTCLPLTASRGWGLTGGHGSAVPTGLAAAAPSPAAQADGAEQEAVGHSDSNGEEKEGVNSKRAHALKRKRGGQKREGSSSSSSDEAEADAVGGFYASRLNLSELVRATYWCLDDDVEDELFDVDDRERAREGGKAKKTPAKSIVLVGSQCTSDRRRIGVCNAVRRRRSPSTSAAAGSGGGGGTLLEGQSLFMDHCPVVESAASPFTLISASFAAAVTSTTASSMRVPGSVACTALPSVETEAVQLFGGSSSQDSTPSSLSSAPFSADSAAASPASTHPRDSTDSPTASGVAEMSAAATRQLGSLQHYFGPMSRCVHVIEAHFTTRPRSAYTAGPSARRTGAAKSPADAAEDAYTTVATVHTVHARCLRTRCVYGGQVQVQVGGDWLSCPLDGTPQLLPLDAAVSAAVAVTLAASADSAGTNTAASSTPQTARGLYLACEDANVFCTPELYYVPPTPQAEDLSVVRAASPFAAPDDSAAPADGDHSGKKQAVKNPPVERQTIVTRTPRSRTRDADRVQGNGKNKGQEGGHLGAAKHETAPDSQAGGTPSYAQRLVRAAPLREYVLTLEVSLVLQQSLPRHRSSASAARADKSAVTGNGNHKAAAAKDKVDERRRKGGEAARTAKLSEHVPALSVDWAGLAGVCAGDVAVAVEEDLARLLACPSASTAAAAKTPSYGSNGGKRPAAAAASAACTPFALGVQHPHAAGNIRVIHPTTVLTAYANRTETGARMAAAGQGGNGFDGEPTGAGTDRGGLLSGLTATVAPGTLAMHGTRRRIQQQQQRERDRREAMETEEQTAAAARQGVGETVYLPELVVSFTLAITANSTASFVAMAHAIERTLRAQQQHQQRQLDTDSGAPAADTAATTAFPRLAALALSSGAIRWVVPASTSGAAVTAGEEKVAAQSSRTGPESLETTLRCRSPWLLSSLSLTPPPVVEQPLALPLAPGLPLVSSASDEPSSPSHEQDTAADPTRPQYSVDRSDQQTHRDGKSTVASRRTGTSRLMSLGTPWTALSDGARGGHNSATSSHPANGKNRDRARASAGQPTRVAQPLPDSVRLRLAHVQVSSPHDPPVVFDGPPVMDVIAVADLALHLRVYQPVTGGTEQTPELLSSPTGAVQTLWESRPVRKTTTQRPRTSVQWLFTPESTTALINGVRDDLARLLGVSTNLIAVDALRRTDGDVADVSLSPGALIAALVTIHAPTCVSASERRATRAMWRAQLTAATSSNASGYPFRATNAAVHRAVWGTQLGAWTRAAADGSPMQRTVMECGGSVRVVDYVLQKAQPLGLSTTDGEDALDSPASPADWVGGTSAGEPAVNVSQRSASGAATGPLPSGTSAADAAGGLPSISTAFTTSPTRFAAGHRYCVRLPFGLGQQGDRDDGRTCVELAFVLYGLGIATVVVAVLLSTVGCARSIGRGAGQQHGDGLPESVRADGRGEKVRSGGPLDSEPDEYASDGGARTGWWHEGRRERRGEQQDSVGSGEAWWLEYTLGERESARAARRV